MSEKFKKDERMVLPGREFALERLRANEALEEDLSIALKANAELVKSARLIADYLENEYGDTDGVIECRRMTNKYEVKQ